MRWRLVWDLGLNQQVYTDLRKEKVLSIFKVRSIESHIASLIVTTMDTNLMILLVSMGVYLT